MKNKKSIMAIIIAILVVVGVTIAYFTTTTSFDNEFVTATYKTTSTETFVGPTNWTPGEEVDKTVVTKNEGSIPVAVRVSYTENWKDSNGDDLDPQPTNKVTINLDNTSDWTHEGNYYYYNYPVEPNETTNSFMKSVTLNSNAITSDSTSCTTSADGKSKTCEASDPLAGAHYTLTLTIETIQYDAYQTVWNPNVTIEPKRVITFVNRQNSGQITTGDLVKIGDTEEFYVVSSDASETVLLARYNLLVGNIYNGDYSFNSTLDSTIEGYGIQNSTARGYVNGADKYVGTLAFSDVNYWEGKVGEGLDYEGSYNDPNYPYVYDENSDLYTYVNNYKDILEEEGITIEEARLLTYQEVENLGCDGSSHSCSSAPSWLYDTTYWLGSANNDYGNIHVDSNAYFGEMDYYDGSAYGVRPVIVISTADIPN